MSKKACTRFICIFVPHSVVNIIINRNESEELFWWLFVYKYIPGMKWMHKSSIHANKNNTRNTFRIGYFKWSTLWCAPTFIAWTIDFWWTFSIGVAKLLRVLLLHLIIIFISISREWWAPKMLLVIWEWDENCAVMKLNIFIFRYQRLNEIQPFKRSNCAFEMFRKFNVFVLYFACIFLSLVCATNGMR